MGPRSFAHDRRANAILTTIAVLAGIAAAAAGAYFLVFNTLDLGTNASQRADEASRVDYGYVDFLDARLETKGIDLQLVLIASPNSNSTSVQLDEMTLYLGYQGETQGLILGSKADADHFVAKAERDSDKSAISPGGPYNRGDLIEIRVDFDAMTLLPASGELIRIWHVQPGGPSVEEGFTLPSRIDQPIERLDRAY